GEPGDDRRRAAGLAFARIDEEPAEVECADADPRPRAALDDRRERARRCFAPAQPGGGGRDAESELRSGAEPDMFGDRVVQRQVQRPFETEERRHPREDAGGTFWRLARLVKDAAPKRQARADAVDREPDA